MRDYLDIIRRNLMSPIVIAIFLLALALLYAGERRDAWFISAVIAVNTVIGIVQEVQVCSQTAGVNERAASTISPRR